jgi:tyrosinase
VPNVFTSPALDVSALDSGYNRADIEFIGVDHAGSSYEGRVFLNNPDADAQTPRAPDHRYAGSYFIFGHGGCLGDVGHCDIRSRDPYDARPGHPLTGARKVLIATDQLRDVLEGKEVTVTIVPVVRSVGPKSGDDEEIVKLDAIRIVTYR